MHCPPGIEPKAAGAVNQALGERQKGPLRRHAGVPQIKANNSQPQVATDEIYCEAQIGRH
jgi:hypothetical protein